MASVNLYGEMQRPAVENTRRAPLGSFIFSLVCIVLVFGVYGGMYVWKGTVNKKIADAEEQISVIKSSLSATGEETNQVHDTFLRLETLQKEPNFDVPSLFVDLEKNIVVGSVVSKYGYAQEGNVVTVEGDAVDFNTLLQQVRKFRSDPTVSSVTLFSTGLSEKGFVLFSIRMTVNISANTNK